MTVWLIGSVVFFAAAAISFLRPLPSIVRSTPGAVLLAALLVARALDVLPEPPTLWVRVLGAIAVAAMTVLAGSAVTATVLGFVMRDDVERGTHGGILVTSADEPARERPQPEVLRGGAAIGFLERFAIVGAVLVGHLEIVAAVIAIKGLGRFTELDTATARERFIVGTLTSSCWAGVGAYAAVSLV